MPDLAKWLSAAADRRRAMDPAALDRLDATLAVLQQDHQTPTTTPSPTTGLNGTAPPGNTGDTSCLAPGPGWTFSVDNPTPASGRPVVGIADRTGVDITRPGPNAVAFTGFGFQPSVQLDTVAGRAPDTAPRSVTLALAGGRPIPLVGPGGDPGGQHDGHRARADPRRRHVRAHRDATGGRPVRRRHPDRDRPGRVRHRHP